MPKRLKCRIALSRLAAAGSMLAFLILLASFPASPPALAQDGVDYSMIVGGRNVGETKIGEKRAILVSKDNPPKDHYTLPLGITADTWNDGTLRIFYRHDRVVQISIDSMVSPLPGDITTSCTAAQVVARHPGLRRISYTAHGSGGGEIDYYDDKAGGIAFEFTRAMMPQPGESKVPKMYAVIVHQKGMNVIPDVGETRSTR